MCVSVSVREREGETERERERERVNRGTFRSIWECSEMQEEVVLGCFG